VNKTFPTLYKKTSTGADQCWEIRVQGDQVTTRFGQVGGAIQETAPTICKGKNIGRANETTPEQQALLEAEAQWTKKLKKDYVLTLDAARKGEASDLIEGGILPMLAHKFSEHGDKLKYPCFVQPKLDGHRCIATPQGLGHALWSRTRKPIRSMQHILLALSKRSGAAGMHFDGELYNHSYRTEFEKLTHFIRQASSEPGCKAVQYHVYDVPGHPGTFRARLAMLQDALSDTRQCLASPLVLVETREVANEDELMLAFEDFLAQGYEGAIARNADSLYVNKRSYDLLKIKKFDDAEFKVTGVEEGKGKMAGHGIFVCQLPGSTVEFRAKMKGALSDLKKYYEHPEKYIGKQLTVQHQGVSKDGIPRFPVALRFV